MARSVRSTRALRRGSQRERRAYRRRDRRDVATRRACPRGYAGDGIDTTFEDLTALAIDRIAVSIYTVAISDDADRDGLEALAEATGGRHVDIQNHGQLLGALHGAAAQLDGLTSFCFTPAACTDAEARITVERGNTVNTRTVTIASTCD